MLAPWLNLASDIDPTRAWFTGVTALVIRALIVFVLGLLAGAGFGKVLDTIGSASAFSLAPTAPDTAKPDAAKVGIGALGRVEPASRVRRIAPPGSISMNRVDRLLVDEGDDVIAGQLLAEFADFVTKDVAIVQAQAAHAEAQAEWARVKAGGRPSDIEAQRERIASLKIQEQIARRDATRADTLVPSGAGARAVADRSDAAANRAAADLREAEARLASLIQPRPEDLAVAEARVRSAGAASARARADAALSRIVAPISGKILKIHARPGDLVGSEGLLELANLDQLEVVADVYETDLPRVRMGALAEIIVPGTSIRFRAKVHEIGWIVRRKVEAGTNPLAAVEARTVEVRLMLEPEGAAALRQRINMQVHVAIQP